MRWNLPDALVWLIVVAALAGAVAVAWFGWRRISAFVGPAEPEEKAATIKAVLDSVGSFLALAGFLFTALALIDSRAATRDALRRTDEGHDLERYSEAIEQLTTPTAAVRIAGIMVLEQLAERDPDAYHEPVMETLAAFVRGARPRPAGGTPGAEAAATAAAVGDQEVRVAIRVVLDREPSRDAGCVDLRGADLRRVEGVFVGRTIANVCFDDADLRGVFFSDAGLDRTSFIDAELVDARFVGASECIRFDLADLAGADFDDATLEYVSFVASTWRSARNLDERLGPTTVVDGADSPIAVDQLVERCGPPPRPGLICATERPAGNVPISRTPSRRPRVYPVRPDARASRRAGRRERD